MKNILIAAAATGAVIAGLILYFQNSNNSEGVKRIKRSARNAYDEMNAGIGHVEKGAQRVLG